MMNPLGPLLARARSALQHAASVASLMPTRKALDAGRPKGGRRSPRVGRPRAGHIPLT